MALPCCLSTISLDPSISLPSSLLSNIVSTSTLIIVSGKFLLGPPTDIFGGHTALILSMFIMSFLSYLATFMNSGYYFGISWMILSFAYSSTWGAVGKVIRENFPSHLWASQISLMAASSRLGNLSGYVIFGLVLNSGLGWRQLFRTSAVIQFSILCVYVSLLKILEFLRSDNQSRDLNRSNTSSNLSQLQHVTTPTSSFEKEGVEKGSRPILSKQNNNIVHHSDNSRAPLSDPNSLHQNQIQRDQLSEESIPMLLKRLSRDPRFYCMLTAKVLLMVHGQFISFLPMYLNSGLGIRPGSASSSSALFPVSLTVPHVLLLILQLHLTVSIDFLLFLVALGLKR